MKKEKLIALGLREEQIRAVLDESSREVQKIKEGGLAKEHEQELSDLRRQLQEWKEKAEQAEKIWQKKLADSRFETAMDRAMHKAGAKNARAVRALICEEQLSLSEDGSIAGLEGQLADLQAKNGYLFEERTAPQFIRFGGTVQGADEEKIRQIMGLAQEK